MPGQYIKLDVDRLLPSCYSLIVLSSNPVWSGILTASLNRQQINKKGPFFFSFHFLFSLTIFFILPLFSVYPSVFNSFVFFI
jgi:hypothetical protein